MWLCFNIFLDLLMAYNALFILFLTNLICAFQSKLTVQIQTEKFNLIFAFNTFICYCQVEIVSILGYNLVTVPTPERRHIPAGVDHVAEHHMPA